MNFVLDSVIQYCSWSECNEDQIVTKVDHGYGYSNKKSRSFSIIDDRFSPVR